LDACANRRIPDPKTLNNIMISMTDLDYWHAEIVANKPETTEYESKVDIPESGKTLVDQLEEQGIIKSPRRRKQVDIILKLISGNPLKIEYGGKVKLKNKCNANHPDLFTDEGFENAWDILIDAGIVKTASHDKYSYRPQ